MMETVQQEEDRRMLNMQSLVKKNTLKLSQAKPEEK